MTSIDTATPPEEVLPSEPADMPSTMAASVALDHLPQDAHAALEHAGELPMPKSAVAPLPFPPSGVVAVIITTTTTVTVRLTPMPNTPALRQPRFKISSDQRFEAVVRFLRRKLQLRDHESVFCYVNSCFAPGLDEGVGNLWRCFKIGEELVVSYSITQAFG